MKRKTRTEPPANDIQLFHLYPNGFVSFGKWMNHHRRMHGRHPLGCLHFGEKWLKRWHAVGEMLQKPAILYMYVNKKRGWLATYGSVVYRNLGSVLATAINDEHWANGKRRVVLAIDGTIVKEWTGK